MLFSTAKLCSLQQFSKCFVWEGRPWQLNPLAKVSCVLSDPVLNSFSH
jgi:hypothetical protein